MEIDSKPMPQHTIAIKEDDDSAPLQQESQGAIAVDNLRVSHSNTVTNPLGQVSVGVKRSASDTELVSNQVPKVAKLGQQPQRTHTAGQSGVAGESVTVPGAESAGQAADTAGQTGPGRPTAATRGFPRTQRATTTPDATAAENMAFGVRVDLKPVKLEWSPVVIADPNRPAKGLGSSARVGSSSARDNYAPGLQLNPIPKRSPQSSLAKDASAAAATSADAVPPSASASAAQEPALSQMFSPVQIKIEDEHASIGMNAQFSPESKSAPETEPLPRNQGVNQTQIKGEQLHEAPAQQTDDVERTAQTDIACDMGQAEVVLPQVSARAAVPVKAEATGMPIGKQAECGHTSKPAAEHHSLVQSRQLASPAVVISSVNLQAGVQIPRDGVKAEVHPQPQGSAGQVIAPGIRMLHPGLGPALSPWSLPSLESAISVPAVQVAVPRSQPAVPSTKLLDSVVGPVLSDRTSSPVAAAKAAPIVVKSEAKHEAKREASDHEVDVSTDTAAAGSASSFNSLNLSALLDKRKQELLGLLFMT